MGFGGICDGSSMMMSLGSIGRGAVCPKREQYGSFDKLRVHVLGVLLSILGSLIFEKLLYHIGSSLLEAS